MDARQEARRLVALYDSARAAWRDDDSIHSTVQDRFLHRQEGLVRLVAAAAAVGDAAEVVKLCDGDYECHRDHQEALDEALEELVAAMRAVREEQGDDLG